MHRKLLDELSKRNEVYELAQRHCRPEKSYYRKGEVDLAIKLQENFRDHRTMAKIIEEFKRICGLEISNLNELYSFLKEGTKRRAESEDELI